MPFPNSHYYLTLHWKNPVEPTEAGQVGIRFDSAVNASGQALVDACKPACQTFWGSVGAAIAGAYSLQFLRLAAIGTDGRYVPGSIAYDGVYASPIAGGGGSTFPMPLSSACASTFTTGVPRGQAATGRIFLPPLTTGLDGNWRWTVAAVNGRSAAVATLLTSLNGALQSKAAVFSRGTVKSTVGAKQTITGVKTGTKPDVQRRRAKGMAELYGAGSSVTGQVG